MMNCLAVITLEGAITVYETSLWSNEKSSSRDKSC